MGYPKIELLKEDIEKARELLMDEDGVVTRDDIPNINSRPYSRELTYEMTKYFKNITSYEVCSDNRSDYYEFIFNADNPNGIDLEDAKRIAKKSLNN